MKSLFPRSFYGVLGMVTGSLSIVALVKSSFDIGLGPTAAVILQYYDTFLNVLLGWATPHIEIFIQRIVSPLNIQIELSEIWKHVMLLTGLYFMRNVARLYEAGRWLGATYQLVFSTIIMFIVGVASGVFEGLRAGFWSDFAVVMSPIFGTFLIALVQGAWFASVPEDRPFRTWPDFGGSWLHFFRCQAWYGSKQLIAGALLTVILLNTPIVKTSTSPAVTVILILVLLLALYWIWVGVRAASSNDVEQTFIRRLFVTPAFQVGMAMLYTIMIVVIFFSMNAVLNLFGL